MEYKHENEKPFQKKLQLWFQKIFWVNMPVELHLSNFPFIKPPHPSSPISVLLDTPLAYPSPISLASTSSLPSAATTSSTNPTKLSTKKLSKEETGVVCTSEKDIASLLSNRKWNNIRYIMILSCHPQLNVQEKYPEVGIYLTSILEFQATPFVFEYSCLGLNATVFSPSSPTSLSIKEKEKEQEKESLWGHCWSVTERPLRKVREYEKLWKRIDATLLKRYCQDHWMTKDRRELGQGWPCPELGQSYPSINVIYEEAVALAVFSEVQSQYPCFYHFAFQLVTSIHRWSMFAQFFQEICRNEQRRDQQSQPSQQLQQLQQLQSHPSESRLRILLDESDTHGELWKAIRVSPSMPDNDDTLIATKTTTNTKTTKTTPAGLGHGSERFSFTSTPTEKEKQARINFLVQQDKDNIERIATSYSSILLSLPNHYPKLFHQRF